MKRFILLLFVIASLNSSGQNIEQKIMYVIDSVAIIDDPDEDVGNMIESDIETLTIVTNKADIELHGYSNLDKLIFIFTKEYTRRPEELKKIPSTKSMENRQGVLYLPHSSTPYSGPFIDYYLNGKKKSDDLAKSTSLGDNNAMVLEARKSYCK